MMNNKISDDKNVMRFTVRFSNDFYDNVKSNAQMKNMSINDYIRDALYRQMQRDTRPTLEIERLNQLIDSVDGMAANLSCLERIVNDSFDNLINITMGDNYLLND